MSLYHIPLAVKALKKAYDDGEDIDARETISLASLVSGMCLANAGLGAAHGIGLGAWGCAWRASRYRLRYAAAACNEI